MATQIQIVNQTLELIAAQTTITALNDGSPAANAALTYYAPTVNLVLRELDPAFSRRTASLILSSSLQTTPWQFEYFYPSDCVRVRQVRPPAAAIDANDPPQVLWQIGFEPDIPTAGGKVILTNTPDALCVYTTSLALEPLWDAAFSEAVVRRLANPLALALSGRPDLARELLEEAERYASLAETVDEG